MDPADLLNPLNPLSPLSPMNPINRPGWCGIAGRPDGPPPECVWWLLGALIAFAVSFLAWLFISECRGK